MNREEQLVRVFVRLADTLTDDFEVIELMQTLAETCRDLLPVEAAGIVLADQRESLRVVATTHTAAELLELFEIQASEGPYFDCFQSGSQVVNVPEAEAMRRWPRFTPRAVAAGYSTVHAVPLRLRQTVIGALNLFCANRTVIEPQDLAVAQGLCDVATIGLLQERALRERHLLAEQLEAALNSRILIEQAKGVLSERAGVTVDEAFDDMRAFARSNNLRLLDVASGVINGSLSLSLR